MKSTSTADVSQKVASILLEIGSVIFRPKQPFKFDSGILSPVYVDNRLLISSPKERKIVINYLVNLAKKIGKVDVIAGTATAGIPHAAWIAEKLNLPMVYVRSSAKDHGRKNQVEGMIKRGQKVLVVEDMVSTAGSSARVVKALRDLGARVEDEIAIYTHNLKESDTNFKRIKVKFRYLTDLKTVTGVAMKKGYLKVDQIKMVDAWVKNPKNWGKKMGFE